MNMPKELIYLNNITVKKLNKAIVSNVTWKVKKGENWAILGLNGSGKTSILKVVTGYEWPVTGSVHVLGNRYGTVNVQEVRKKIGWVSSALDERFSTRPNDTAFEVVLSGKFASVGVYEMIKASDIKDVELTLALFQIEALSNQPFRTLSQGEQKKVMLARAWIANPNLLILDEPCNGLDLFSREQFLNSIQAASKEKAAPTMIYVTHHIDEILPCFTHCLLLKDGQIFAQGKKEEIMIPELLSQAFNLKLTISWDNERAWIKVIK
ncbi:ABC transporter ATP-binding protein [Alkalihalobacterium bogoriense]|uniref:ABC transporter ATP-binding protein n=1 Tax=Alkalihalobacterium bogoriense TaxID=246272 RepID=UPI000551EE10|nr:ABC transporter ATP-binding protein [Alkalihalobacterium bogoriense]